MIHPQAVGGRTCEGERGRFAMSSAGGGSDTSLSTAQEKKVKEICSKQAQKITAAQKKAIEKSIEDAMSDFRGLSESDQAAVCQILEKKLNGLVDDLVTEEVRKRAKEGFHEDIRVVVERNSSEYKEMLRSKIEDIARKKVESATLRRNVLWAALIPAVIAAVVSIVLGWPPKWLSLPNVPANAAGEFPPQIGISIEIPTAPSENIPDTTSQPEIISSANSNEPIPRPGRVLAFFEKIGQGMHKIGQWFAERGSSNEDTTFLTTTEEVTTTVVTTTDPATTVTEPTTPPETTAEQITSVAETMETTSAEN